MKYILINYLKSISFFEEKKIYIFEIKYIMKLGKRIIKNLNSMKLI
jgi:hypothetical protein